MYSNPEPPDELIKCFDENGNEIEPHTRAEIHSQPLKYWHGTTGIWVVNKNGQLLCSKRGENLTQAPGCWQSRFGGHVKSGQSFLQNAVAELDEEAGIQIQEKDLHAIGGLRKHEASKHFGQLYACLFTGLLEDLRFNDGEITQVKWMSMEDFWKEFNENNEHWVSGCSLEDQEKIKQWLKTHD